MKAIAVVATLLTATWLLLAPYSSPEDDPGTAPAITPAAGRFAQAERDYAEGSFARAHELYREFDELALPVDQARWVDFRLADTLWRSQAATENADTTLLDQARQDLEALVRDLSRVEDRDAIWVEVQESLGDFWWGRRNSRNWGAAWSYYQAALDWWAGSVDIGQARTRYLAVVWKVAEPPEAQPYYSYGYYGNYLPVNILENALEIATVPDEQARAHYLLAMTLRQQGGDWKQLRRVPEEFEAALAAGRGSGWYDDALFQLAQWWADRGQITLQDGNWTQQHDYVEAVSLYRRLLREYSKGETRYYDQARQKIENITRPAVGVGVSNIFLPGSEIEFHLNWRNVQRLEVSLYSFDLLTDPRFGQDSSSRQWLQQLDLLGREPYSSWSLDTEDTREHRPGSKTLRLDDELPVGAYLLVARGGGETARDLVLVSDAALVMTVSGKKVLLYACDVLDGSPLPGAEVKLWERTYHGKHHIWDVRSATTDEEGLALFDLPHDPDDRSYRELFAVARSGQRQSFAMGNRHYRATGEPRWQIQAFTDRPAYRPGETVRWKLVARRHDGSVYSTPAGETLLYEITDPQGAKVDDGSVSLNAFGSAWGTLEVNESMPLGAYQVQYRTGDRNRHIGSAVLFRLEEYKLPEFRVSIETPEDDAGNKRAFRLGDSVEVTIQADYYFGGPVASATVEVLVYQNPFAHYWAPPRDYPWLYEDMVPRRGGWGRGGQVVQRETVRTDASGRAVIHFDTSPNAGQDLEYRVEARVIDASRREVVGSDTVRVSRQGYYVHPRARHYLHRPQDEVTIDFRALDPNENPKQVSGTVKVTRDTYVEIWVDPQGREVRGDALQLLRRRLPVFPPPPASPGSAGWQLRFSGYEHEDILTRTLQTDAEGHAELSFVPQREGYYRVSWSSEDEGHGPITAETTVWVATGSTTELGYRHGGVEIIVDRDTFHAGEKAAVMLVAPTNDRYVLFTVAGEELYSYRLVHITGTVKLLQLDIGEEHVPNIFLTATMVSDGDSFQDVEQVVIPPVKHFLSVEVGYDRETYEPREKGFITVRTTDHEGRPVSAEVSLGVTDESIYYIQQDLAQDPRQFFFGSKRGLLVRTTSTLQQRRYRKLGAKDDDGIVVGGKRERNEFHRGRGDMSVAGYAVNDRMEVAQKSISALNRAAAPMAMEEAVMDMVGPAGSAGAVQPAVQVRSDFRSTMFWQPDVITGKDGTARVEVAFPDSLTSWRATARVQARDQRFGMEKAVARTRKPLIVRLQAPRFFVVGDRLTVSALLNNNTDQAMTVSPSLHAEGLVVRGGASQVQVPAGGETRVDWQVEVTTAGPAVLTVTGRGGAHADAMRRDFRVYEHGVEKFLSRSGKVYGDEVLLTLDLPASRPGSQRMTVQIAPSLAVTILDALPYLIDYPYGCTEQTMSRFLPAAIVARTLADAGLDAEALAGKMFGGIESEYASSTHAKGKNDLQLLDDMIRKGLDRLYDFQHSDGGWGWWKDGESDHYMTAYVVWGLTLARQADIDVRRRVLERAVHYLEQEIVEQERRHDLAAWMLHALAVHHQAAGRGVPAEFTAAAFDKLWEDRAKLNAYTRALLALSAHYLGDAQRAQTLVRNLENGVQRDETPDTSVVQRGSSSSHSAVQGTAHWGVDGIYRRWSEGGVEATAFVLRALLAIDPANELVEPVTNWLVKNRRGAQWSNTRDTAIVVLTLNETLRVSGELEADVDYEVLVNGHSVQRRKLTGADALAAPSRLAVDPEWIRNGANEVRIVRHGGSGPLYFAAELAFFSLEEPVTAAGSELFVRRQYYKLVPRPTLLKGVVLEKIPLNDGEQVRSGERVEVVLTIEAKNDYEYLVFEDLKPAGLEAVQVRSGEALYARELKSGAAQRRFGDANDRSARMPGSDLTGRSRTVYQELRDRKVVLFLDKLPQGMWEIRYELRAEVPGSFHALPVLGHAMYVPEIRCNGEEIRITVLDRPGP